MEKIDIYSAARSGAAWRGRLALSAMSRLCASLTDAPGDRDALLTFGCRGFTDAQGRPALELQLAATLPVRCDRCGLKLALPLEAERVFYFVTSQAELAAIPIDDTPEEALLGSPQFDLAALIEDEAILQLPISPRHADCVAVIRNAPVPPQFADAPAGAAPPHPFAGLAALRDQLQEPVPAGATSASGKSALPKNGALAVTSPRKPRSRAS